MIPMGSQKQLSLPLKLKDQPVEIIGFVLAIQNGLK